MGGACRAAATIAAAGGTNRARRFIGQSATQRCSPALFRRRRRRHLYASHINSARASLTTSGTTRTTPTTTTPAATATL